LEAEVPEVMNHYLYDALALRSFYNTIIEWTVQ
jgi:hypothetical protein